VIERVLNFPWGRLTCIIVGALGFFNVDNAEWGVPVFAASLFSAVALHGLAIWRAKP
jgi:hypothetical protein